MADFKGLLLCVVYLAFPPLLQAQNEPIKTLAVTEGQTVTSFKLYGSSNAAYTWNAAFNFCTNADSQLVTITNQDIQSLMANLSNVTTGGTRHVWISGRVTTDTWRYVDGSQGDGLNHDCGFRTSGGSLNGNPCGDSRYQRALCQYGEDNESCILDTLYNGKCYHVYNHGQGFHWYAARQACRSMFEGGDLAYSNLEDQGLTDSLGQTNNMWIGLTSRRNVWILENDEEVPIGYNRFRGGTQLGDVYFDAGDGGKWSTKPSGDSSNYFVCQKKEALTTTPSPTPAPTPPSTTTSPSTTSTTTQTITTTTITPLTTTLSPTTTPSPTTTTPPPTTQAPTAAPTTSSGEQSQTGAPVTSQDTTTTTTSKTTTTTREPSTEEVTPAGSSTNVVGPLMEMHVIIIGVVGGVLLIVIIVFVAVIVTRGKRNKDPDFVIEPTYSSHINPNAGSVINLPPDPSEANVYSEVDKNRGSKEGGRRQDVTAEMTVESEAENQADVGDGYKIAPTTGDIYRLPDNFRSRPTSRLDPQKDEESDPESIPDE